MRRPSVRDLAPALGQAARGVAAELARNGKRGWLVGGAVRDLALGIQAKDVDLATAARPEEVEALFPTVHEVGRAFGTCVVSFAGVDVQVTTFRTETGYADARRPDEVRYARELEEDAGRRDFTCNALYLDPLSDELRDPTGGLADLEAGVLRCVGEPRRRFAEDGLRLLRLARFAAGYGLAIDPATRAGARESLAALRGVSAERVLTELEGLSARPGAARGWSELEGLGVLERLPGLSDPPPIAPADLRHAVAVLAAIEGTGAAAEAPPLPLALAVLLASEEDPRRLARRLTSLRGPRRLAGEVERLTALRTRVQALLVRERERGAPERAERIRVLRDAAWPLVARWVRGAGDDAARRGLAALEAFRAGLAPEDLEPTPWITSQDLARAGLARGPRWAELLEEAETRRLDGRDATRAEALAWLARRVASGGREHAPQPERER